MKNTKRKAYAVIIIDKETNELYDEEIMYFWNDDDFIDEIKFEKEFNSKFQQTDKYEYICKRYFGNGKHGKKELYRF